MAAIQVFMTGKRVVVGRRSQQPRLSAKAFLADMLSESVDLTRVGNPVSIGPFLGIQAGCPCCHHFSDDARCLGST